MSPPAGLPGNSPSLLMGPFSSNAPRRYHGSRTADKQTPRSQISFPHKGGPDMGPRVSLMPRLPMPDSQTLGLIIAASVAAVLLFRLYTVLGRRTGHEPQPGPRPQPQTGEPRAIAALPSDPVARGVMDIQLDRKSTRLNSSH